MNGCLHCGTETTNPKFCSSSCSARYNNRGRKKVFKNDKRTKIINCCDCGIDIEVNIRSPKNGTKCKICRRKKICKSCGEILGTCKRRDICRKHRFFPTLIKYFGFDKSVIGTIDIYREYERISSLLYEEYWDVGMSIPEMSKKYNFGDSGNFRKILIAFGIKRRTMNEGLSKSYLRKDRKFPQIPNYKQGWHTTWNEKKVFYRSSYELNYCKILDDQKIDYEMEELRILYWDTQLQRERVAIPDFHIPEDNMIVEIKGDYTYDKQNMIDRADMFEKLGYEFKMILEGKEYNKENLP